MKETITCPVKLFRNNPEVPPIMDPTIGDCKSCDGILEQKSIKVTSSLHEGYGAYHTGMVVYGKLGCGMKVLSEPQELPIYK